MKRLTSKKMSDYQRNVMWHVGILLAILAIMIMDGQHRPVWAFVAIPLGWAAFFPSRKAYDSTGNAKNGSSTDPLE